MYSLFYEYMTTFLYVASRRQRQLCLVYEVTGGIVYIGTTLQIRYFLDPYNNSNRSYMPHSF
jgi:hypothetical protein